MNTQRSSEFDGPDYIKQLDAEQLQAALGIYEACQQAAEVSLPDGFRGCLIREPFPMDGRRLFPCVQVVAMMFRTTPGPDRLDVVSQDSWWLSTELDGLVTVGMSNQPAEDVVAGLKADMDSLARASIET